MIMDNDNSLTGGKRRRKLTEVDIKAIADLITARKLTETEACISLDIKPEQWQVWKCRGKHGSKFESLIARARTENIKILLGRIDSASQDAEIEINGKVITKRGDWRAAAWLAEKTDARFQDAQAPANVTNNLQIVALHETLKKVFNSPIVNSSPVCDVDRVSIADDGLKRLKASPIKLPTRRV